MALLNFLKNKKKVEEIKESKETTTTKAAVKKAPKSAKKEEGETKISFKGRGAGAVLVLQNPHVTEKATSLAENDKYVFEVSNTANKTEIKKSIEKLYNVKVLNINILNMPGKKRRAGKSYGTTSGFKKAIATLPKGQKIDILAQ